MPIGKVASARDAIRLLVFYNRIFNLECVYTRVVHTFTPTIFFISPLFYHAKLDSFECADIIMWSNI